MILKFDKKLDNYNTILDSLPKFDLKPVFDEQGNEIRQYKSVFDIKTNKVVSIVSNKYKLINHYDLLNSIKTIFDSDLFSNAKIYLIKKTKMIIDLFTNREFSVIKNDNVKFFIRVINSVDSTTGLNFFPSTWRLVCSNGLVHTDQLMRLTFKHFYKILNNNDLIHDIINQICQMFDNIIKNYREFAESKVKTVDQLTSNEKKWIDDNIPDKYQIVLQKQYQNAWGLLNDLTYLNSHDIKRNEYTKTLFNSTILKFVNILTA